MDKEQLHKEIIHNLLYPRKIPFAVLLKELSVNEFILIASFLAYEYEHKSHITVNELASRMDVTVPAVSRALRHLEQRGLIKRICNKDCRRNTFVKISSGGKKLFEENWKAIESMVDKILEELTPEEIEASIAFNKKVLSIMDRECKAFVTENQMLNRNKV